ncbi:MAG: hypothetical protein JSR58_02900 [Verrucomicrobia bacterium]|nr:hypothetical protein [Verrucomicrobiota bacterium]
MSILIALIAFLCPLGAFASGAVVTPTLLEFLKEMKIQHDGTLPSMVDATLAAGWMRPLQVERWQIPDLNVEQRGVVLSYAAKMGLFEPRYPEQKHYDYAIVMGGATFRMERRMKFLKEIWDKGTRFDRIVVLSGERPLDPAVEKIPDGCKTETEAAHAMWKTRDFPAELKGLPVTFIDTPMIAVFGGKRRPGTADTITKWIKTHPKPGSCLIITNQPYINYQAATIRLLLPKGFTLEASGAGAVPAETNAADILDSIARWLYQEGQHPKNTKR